MDFFKKENYSLTYDKYPKCLGHYRKQAKLLIIGSYKTKEMREKKKIDQFIQQIFTRVLLSLKHHILVTVPFIISYLFIWLYPWCMEVPGPWTKSKPQL